MSVIVSHPTGNANLRAVLRGLYRKKILQSFYTTIAFPQANMLKRLFGETINRRLEQRRYTDIPWSKISVHPVREFIRLSATALGLDGLTIHEKGWASIDAVYQNLDNIVSNALLTKRNCISGVYAYEDGALNSFRIAKKNEIMCLYDLPIAYWQRVQSLLKEESERLPEWTSTLLGLDDSFAKLNRKDEEIFLADHIFVASSFTSSSLLDYFGDSLSVSIIPYGCPVPLNSRSNERLLDEPLQIIFVGRINQRKGIADLIHALGMLDVDWRLILVGSIQKNPPSPLISLLSDERCKWLGTIPHSSLMRIMTQAHVLVFPSIVEGFGMVITEALSAGLPVITTPNTAGPDLLTEGYNGFIVPIRSPDSIAQRLSLLANNETLRMQMSINALKTAKANSWLSYETEVSNIIYDKCKIS